VTGIAAKTAKEDNVRQETSLPSARVGLTDAPLPRCRAYPYAFRARDRT